MLVEFFQIEYDCSDWELIDFIIELDWLPEIFKRENFYSEYKTLPIDKILETKLEYKPLGGLFDKYTTSYPFSQEKANKELKILSERSGRLLIYEAFFLWFSDYVPHYVKSLEVLMDEEGLLPFDWRYFIALMAVSTIRSHYLLLHVKYQFLLKGGDEDWLVHGLSAVPEKLQKLSKLNNILAHQPWKLTLNDLNELLSKGWTREELVNAALILIYYHKLAAITEALKFKFIESTGLTPFRTSSTSFSSEAKEEREGKTKLYNNLVQMNEETEEKILKIQRKFSSGDDPKIVYKIEEDNTRFDFFISKYCTLYLDYDAHSETTLSNLVRYYLLRNSIGTMKGIIFSIIFILKELKLLIMKLSMSRNFLRKRKYLFT